MYSIFGCATESGGVPRPIANLKTDSRRTNPEMTMQTEINNVFLAIELYRKVFVSSLSLASRPRDAEFFFTNEWPKTPLRIFRMEIVNTMNGNELTPIHSPRVAAGRERRQTWANDSRHFCVGFPYDSRA